MSSKPAPTQESFDELIEGATTIRVREWVFRSDAPLKGAIERLVAGAKPKRILEWDFRNEALLTGTAPVFETVSRVDLASFRTAFEIETSGPFQCACIGDLVIELRDDRRLRAALTLHHGKSIPWDGWSSDAELRNGRRAVDWLSEHGVEQPRLDYETAEAQGTALAAGRRRWEAAMPFCLRQFLPRVMNDLFPFQVTAAELREMDQSLEAASGSEEQAVINLLGWYGQGEGPWSGFPAYEEMAAKLLLCHPTSVILRSLEGRQLAWEQVEAAARLFSSFSFSKERQADLKSIPPQLMARLASHMQASDFPDNRERFQRTFRRWAVD